MSDIKFLFPTDFWTAVHNRQTEGQRFGQAVFNVAYMFYPHIAGPLTATPFDPFHHDEKVNDFLHEVWERLQNAA